MRKTTALLALAVCLGGPVAAEAKGHGGGGSYRSSGSVRVRAYTTNTGRVVQPADDVHIGVPKHT